MSGFDFTIACEEAPLEVPIPGDTVLMLQMLSDVDSIVTTSAIGKWTNTDPLLSMARRMVLQGWESQPDPEFKPYTVCPTIKENLIKIQHM